MFRLSRLSREDRDLYDDTIYDAVMRSDGTTYPTREAGQRLYDAMRSLTDDGYNWADDFIASCAIELMGKRAKEWAKSEELIDTVHGQRRVRKSARIAVKRRSTTGELIDQLTLWEMATREDLAGVLKRGAEMINGLRVDMSTARKLLDLLDQHSVDTVSDALTAEGISLQDFLLRDEAAS